MNAVQLLGASKQDSIQAAACSAFGRVLRFSPSLIPAVAMRAGSILMKILELQEVRMQVLEHCISIIPSLCVLPV